MRVPLPRRRPLRIAVLAAFILAFVVVATGLNAILFPVRAAASSSSLEVLDGIVAVSHDGVTFTEGHDGDLIQQGDVVRTGSDSHAVLTFYDGSIVEVEPDSELIVDTLAATTAGDIVMAMRQTVGRSWHVVSRSLTPDSRYEVRTPSATATVRGTSFLVSVDPAGGTNFQTTDGVVGAIAGGEEVQVPPGFETNVRPGTPPDPATPAPQPQTVVRIVVDLTPNAAVVDGNRRTVGVVNGLPIRYVPGSTVRVVDGKLVITIPNPTLGRLNTHVQPADPAATSVDVNVQVQVGDATVGNVVERRSTDVSGIAKGGVVITTTGTFIVPDADAGRADDPAIGRVPPPPGGIPFIPFIPVRTVAPTPIVTPPPSFTTRFVFDPRLTVLATPSPAPTLAGAVFNGAFQPFVDTRTATSTATPAPNVGLTVFTTVPADLAKLTSPTPTPAPTLNPKLLATLAPVLLATPTPTQTTLILRTVDPILLRTAAPTPTPAPTLILRTLSPIITLAPVQSPAPTPAPTLILRTLLPIITRPPVITFPPPATLVPTPAPTLAPPPILVTLPPRTIPTIAPTPSPTLAPVVPIFSPVLPRIVTPSPSPSPIRLTLPPRCFPPFC